MLGLLNCMFMVGNTRERKPFHVRRPVTRVPQTIRKGDYWCGGGKARAFPFSTYKYIFLYVLAYTHIGIHTHIYPHIFIQTRMRMSCNTYFQDAYNVHAYIWRVHRAVFLLSDFPGCSRKFVFTAARCRNDSNSVTVISIEYKTWVR